MRKCHVMHWLSFGKKQLNPDFTPRSRWTSKTLVFLPYLRDVRLASAVLWSNRSFKKHLFTAFMSNTHFKHRWLTVFKPKYFFQNLLLLQSFFVMSTSSCSNTLENSRPPLPCSPFTDYVKEMYWNACARFQVKKRDISSHLFKRREKCRWNFQ